ncbi:DEAD/DEAH box helicase family protein [Crocosphaera sp. XPORK-15E]|uniref:DEAD/DEAH box helicase family protein n=1 Tax=Crocosphaera sp. XPORK-15E TaxID=3110247 RepID=UPI002B2146CA|nr:DEAD/DEAH box helicase family protein [Crocosphaera sp. XPORK-15E]MEA5535853.1 DEAD/DEAH box helicase family protein [Crocosphaera sp. XPORK-15E]
MTSNFDFLKEQFPQLFTHATHTESMAYSAPRASCFYARFTLEQAVFWLYDNDAYLQPPYDNNLAALIHEPTFKDNLKPGLFPKIRTIHKIGNLAAHSSSQITTIDSLRIVEDLFHFLYWLCRYYSVPPLSRGARGDRDITFNRQYIPHPETSKDLSREQLTELETQLSQASEMKQIAEKRQQQTEAELNALRQEIKTLKQQNEAVADTHDYHEADTRRYLLDILLKEAGWNINHPDATEFEVQGMPNNSGKGYVDYVLWGDDGKPLALLEAKRTSSSPTKGKQQAKLYADCLEKKFSQRPVIFYSNGYNHWIWDDCTYPPREIDSFLQKDELERIIFRRSHRKSLDLVMPNKDIAGRTYQLEALKRISETFNQQNARKSLLVMATGTGKTRTAIALVDLLMRANWVKRVLFLADRNALLTQAFRNFKTHLPTVTPVNLIEDKKVKSVKNKNAGSANVILSTYPTMFNRISNQEDAEFYMSPGYFDLVIVDEAHRGIYQKYQALFQYFDSLLVGLTATPRSEVHRDTYKIFDLEAGVPTFAYELQDAIKDGYLVPSQGITVPFKFLRQGVKYSQLSEEEQEEYEEKFRDEETGELPNEVNAAAINKWLFNKDTVDQALRLLMEKGLKVEAGDRLGKTIIFARNHDHAEFIVKRFDVNYPHYQGKFAQVIDSHNNYAQSLLDEFSEPHKEPTIAVSVDMLDTGVDIPEVVNLVFFKPVYSRVKFNQMIGRGTRLCPDLFGISQNKEKFLIFDLCSNFDFFNQEIEEKDPKQAESISAKLVKARLAVSQILLDKTLITDSETSETDNKELRNALLDNLHQHVATMETNNFLVRRHLQQVEKFSKRDRWNQLSESDTEEIAEYLANLPNGLPKEDELAKRFDLLCLKLQLSILKNTKDFISLRDKLRDLLDRLEEKQTIPMVKEQLPLIEAVQNETWWSDVTPMMVESIRLKIRDLVKFIDRSQQTIVYTDFKDELGDIELVDVPLQQTGFSPYQYRKKVEAYIREHEDHIAIYKLKRNVPLTDGDLSELEKMLFSAEEVESRDRFEQVYGKDLSLKLFIRKIVGLDRNAAKDAFARYWEDSNFSANQIRFVENIIDYLTQNGVMNPGLLYESPFTDIHHEGLDGVFNDDQADEIVTLVKVFNQKADYSPKEIA